MQYSTEFVKICNITACNLITLKTKIYFPWCDTRQLEEFLCWSWQRGGNWAEGYGTHVPQQLQQGGSVAQAGQCKGCARVLRGQMHIYVQYRYVCTGTILQTLHIESACTGQCTCVWYCTIYYVGHSSRSHPSCSNRNVDCFIDDESYLVKWGSGDLKGPINIAILTTYTLGSDRELEIKHPIPVQRYRAQYQQLWKVPKRDGKGTVHT